MATKRVVVMVNGCFDLLHVGHVDHLEEARSFGDELVVALTADWLVSVEKGRQRPVVEWRDRARVLSALRCVDRVVRCDGLLEVLRAMRPAVLVKGVDWRGRMPQEIARCCAELGVRLRFTSSEKRSTTEVIERIREAK